MTRYLAIGVSLLLALCLAAGCSSPQEQEDSSSESQAAVSPEPSAADQPSEDESPPEDDEPAMPPESPDESAPASSAADAPVSEPAPAEPPAAQADPEPTGAFTLTAEPESYPLDAEEVTVVMRNGRTVEGSADMYYKIERELDGVWTELPLAIEMTDIGLILPPGGEQLFTVSLHRDQYDYEPGSYRIIKQASDTEGVHELYAAFALEG